jgi:hypothetical protein
MRLMTPSASTRRRRCAAVTSGSGLLAVGGPGTSRLLAAMVPPGEVWTG